MRVTVWIRKENEDKWAEIDNKSDWINSQLDGTEPDLERRVRRIAREEARAIVDELQSSY